MKSIRQLCLLLVGLTLSSLGFASSSDCLGKGEGGKAFQRGNFIAAAEHWENARLRLSKNTPEYINTSVCLADAYLRLGRLKAAFPILEEAQFRADKINDSVSRAKVLMGLSDVYVAMRDYQYKKTDYGMRKIRDTIPFYQTDDDKKNTLSQKEVEARKKILKKEHILQKALDTLEEADKILVCDKEKTPYPLLCANLLNRRGQVLLLQIHHFHKKSEVMTQQMKLLPQGPVRYQKKRDRNTSKKTAEDKYYKDYQALVKSAKDKYYRGLAKYENKQSLANIQAANQILGVKISLNHLQTLQFGYKNKLDEEEVVEKKAKEELEPIDKASKTLYRRIKELPDSHDKTSALISLAQLMRDLPPSVVTQPRRRAYNLLTEAFRVAKKNDDIFSMAEAKGYQAELYAELGRYNEAVRLARSAIFHVQRYPHFHFQNYPKQLARLQWQLGTYLEKQGQYQEAIQAYENASDSFQKARQYCGSVSPSILDMEEKMDFEWANLLLKEASKASSEKEKHELLAQAIDALELFKQAELRNYFQDECITEKKVIEVDELLSSHPNVAVFYPIVLKNRVELLLISNKNRKIEYKQLNGFEIKTAEEEPEYNCEKAERQQSNRFEKLDLSKAQPFHQAVQCFRKLLEVEQDRTEKEPKANWLEGFENKYQKLKKEANVLYQLLLQPVTKVLDKQPQIDTLIIVPSDILYAIPFAALHDGQDFVLQKDYALVVTPSLKLTDPTPLSRDFRRVLLSGTTKFEDKEINWLEYVQAELNKISCVLMDNLKVDDDNSFAIETLDSWINNPPCLSNPIDRLFGYEIDRLFDKEFTLSNLKDSFRKVPYSIVHLATHARFDLEPEETFLQTSEGKRDEALGKIFMNDLEEFVHLAEFRTQPIELLTLSACETAQGDKHAALGLSGLALKAGARSVVGTLWEVKDPATAYMMVEFYRQLKKEPNWSIARALQEAQRRLWRLGKEATGKNNNKDDEKYQHPHYWSPFLLIGNWM